MKTLKIIVDKHSDGSIAYPLGLQGAVVGEGDTYEEALADAKSAAQFHIETFKQSWQQAMAGETSPVSELWEGIDAESITDDIRKIDVECTHTFV